MNFIRKILCRLFGHKTQCEDRECWASVHDAFTGESRETTFHVHIISCSRCGEILLPIPQGEVQEDGGQLVP